MQKAGRMTMVAAKSVIVAAGIGVVAVGGAWALTSGADGGDPAPAPTFQPWNDPIFGPDAEENAAELKAEKDRNAKLVEEALLALDFVEHDGPGRERAVEGRIYLNPQYARTYNYHLPDLVGLDGSPISSSTDEVALATARSSRREGEPLLLANDKYEVIVDYATNKRFVIDHDREIIQEEPLVVGGNRPNTILADAEKKDPAAAKRLEQMFGQFTKPRLDPKRQFKLGPPTGSGKSVTVNELPVTCTYHEFDLMGGTAGEVCLTDAEDVEGLVDIKSIIDKFPLAGAGKNDVLSRMRQLSEIAGPNRFPVSFKFRVAGMDGDDFDTDLTGFDVVPKDSAKSIRDLPANYQR